MTIELWYLFLTSILLTVLWIPHIYGQATTQGPLTPEDYVNLRDYSKFPAWVRRADRAHINLVEQFGAFAGLVLIAHVLGISTTLTVWAAATFFFARLLHTVVMISGFKHFMFRTVVFTVAFLALLVFAWEIFANAG